MASLSSSFKNKIYEQLLGEHVLSFPHALCVEKGYTSVPLFRSLLILLFILARNISQSLTKNHVSVGSGSGGMETLIFEGNDFIGVDPDPMMGFEGYSIFHQPEFETVDFLVKKRPEVVGDCSLWLMWPNNSCTFCEMNECIPVIHHPAYDFEAIRDLKPKAITMMVSLKQRTSGSIELDNFVKNWKKSNYELVFTCSSIDVSGFSMRLYPLIVEVQFFFFVRKDIFRPNFKLYFEKIQLPSVFYTMDDYLKIRASIPPEKLIFDTKSLELLETATNKAKFNPLMSRIKELEKLPEDEQKKQITAIERTVAQKTPSVISPSNVASTVSSSTLSSSPSPPSSSHKEDIGFYFIFE